MIKLAILGSCGKMGQRIYTLAKNSTTFQVTALLEKPHHPEIGKVYDELNITSDLSTLKKADVVIDFTLPEAIKSNIDAALQANTKMVIGTTGLSIEQASKIDEASVKIPIVFSSNMSVGVNILFKLVYDLQKKLGKNYSSRIIEAHHRHKKDAPSGTAKTIAQIIKSAGGTLNNNIESIREGEIIGNHSVFFESPVDMLTIGHHAKTRDIFAEGALVAAKFVYTQASGLFSMQDVLGLT